MSARFNKDISTPKTQLISAEVEDQAFIEEVYFSTRYEEFVQFGCDKSQIENLLRMQFNAQTESYKIHFPLAEYFIILSNNEKAGRMIINRSEFEIRLVDISLLPEFRRIGIGTEIIRLLQKEARKQKQKITLKVAENNISAFRLYQKLGFQISDKDEMYILMEF